MSAGLPNRRSIRLKGANLCDCIYFVTICTEGRKRVFGRVANDTVELSEAGGFARDEWLRTAILRPDVILDEFTVMPNPIHAILYVPRSPDDPRAHCRAPLRRPSRSLASLIAQYKGAVTRRIGRPVWQRGFYDHVIRNDKELETYRTYVRENPSPWPYDRQNIKPSTAAPAHRTAVATSR